MKCISGCCHLVFELIFISIDFFFAIYNFFIQKIFHVVTTWLSFNYLQTMKKKLTRLSNSNIYSEDSSLIPSHVMYMSVFTFLVLLVCWYSLLSVVFVEAIQFKSFSPSLCIYTFMLSLLDNEKWIKMGRVSPEMFVFFSY